MKFLVKTGALAVAAGLVFGLGTTTFVPDAKAAWKPKKSVEFIIMAGTGGGAVSGHRHRGGGGGRQRGLVSYRAIAPQRAG